MRSKKGTPDFNRKFMMAKLLYAFIMDYKNIDTSGLTLDDYEKVQKFLEKNINKYKLT